MARELAIDIFLFFFRILFNICKLLPQKRKTVGVASFGDNIHFITRSIHALSDESIIILKDPACSYPFDTSFSRVIPFTATHPISFLKSIYHLATATTILVDNYYGFLAVTNFKEDTTCVQVWHAAGAVKQFGLNDPSIKNRSEKAKARFQKVYDRFHYTIVGSEKMAAVFRNSFHVSNASILRTGIPRTDLFYDPVEKQKVIQHVKTSFPTTKNKKVILYTPTFRDGQLTNYQLALDIKKMYQAFSEDYVLFIKVHPAVSYVLNDEYADFVYDVSDYYDTNHLLLFADLLITDYSSIPFEYALLNKPIIFFAYDIEQYSKERGLVADYHKQMPGPIVSTTEAIIQTIKMDTFDMHRIQTFASQWNEYSTGQSSLNVAKIITNREEAKEKVLI